MTLAPLDAPGVPVLELRRFMTGPMGTFGEITPAAQAAGARRWRPMYSIELPWRENRRWISCIPVGTYRITLWTSPSKGRCIKVHAVPGRKHILIHAGNRARETTGCILPGNRLGAIGTHWAVLASGSDSSGNDGAFDRLMDWMPDADALLRISVSPMPAMTLPDADPLPGDLA
ncbi:MAG: DUF5675 family protein [Acidobacteriota bacterium]